MIEIFPISGETIQNFGGFNCTMNSPEHSDPVWKLLSHAKRTEPSAFFARNVVREARILSERKNDLGVFHALSQIFKRRMILAGAVGAVAILALSLIKVSEDLPESDNTTSEVAHSSAIVDSFDPATEMAAIEYLGQLMAVTDPGQLEDAALADLFF